LEYVLAESTGKSHSAYIQQITEFTIIGYSYVLGKLCLYTITHWLEHRESKGQGQGKKIETIATVRRCSTYKY
jgi:hypothetical protein